MSCLRPRAADWSLIDRPRLAAKRMSGNFNQMLVTTAGFSQLSSGRAARERRIGGDAALIISAAGTIAGARRRGQATAASAAP